ncbi:MAG: long-chain fatty acid--CoA ligase [Clostridiales bacterium]|nr:long-chain fatty acid--CoA ligase [Clostridiales bacterium]
MDTVYKNPYDESRWCPTYEITDLKDLVRKLALLYRDKPAYLYKEKKGGPYLELTHAQLAADVDALGTKLLDLGLAGSKIAVMGDSCYQWMLAYFAVACGIGTVVPLDKELQPEEILNLVETADCKAIFYTSSQAKKLEDCPVPLQIKMEVYSEKDNAEDPNTLAHLLEEGRKLLEAGDRSYLDQTIDPETLCSLLFTSGTTGVPKGVMLSHRNLVSNVKNSSRLLQLKEDDRSLSILPIHHTFESTLGNMLVLYQGGSIAFCEGLKYVTKNMEECKASILVGVPLIFESVYDKIWKQAKKSGKAAILKKLIGVRKGLKTALGVDTASLLMKSVKKPFGGKLRLLVTGAAAIDPNVLRGFLDMGFEVLQGYGLTETAPLVAGTPEYVDRYKKAGSCGPVIPEGEIRILDPNEDGIGEILYKGPNVMMGYYNMPEETAEVLKDGWFYTGDLGFVDEQGWVYITGRKKNVIVTKTGKNIYPEEIEQYLSVIPYIKECMVYGLETDNDEGQGEGTLVAVQVIPDLEAVEEKLGHAPVDEDTYLLLKDAIAEVNRKIPSYKRVHKITIRETEFVKTTTKKIRRQDNIPQ